MNKMRVFILQKTMREDTIKQNLNQRLKQAFNQEIATYFCDNIKDIDLEIIQLKIKNGIRISDEVEIIMNIIQNLEEIFIEKTTDKKTINENEYFIQNIYKEIAECFKIIV